MKPKTSKGFKCLKCFKCLVYFYLCLICISGISIIVLTSYLLIFHQENNFSKPKTIILCFLIVPTLLIFVSTILGWLAIKKKKINLLKFFAVLLAVTDIIEIAGCLWCFITIPQVNDEVFSFTEEKFSAMPANNFTDSWWNAIQSKYKCCGLYGPTDYATAKAVPISCCGSDPEDESKGSCSFLWQKGCASALTNEVSEDLLYLGLLGLGVAFIQVPGIFISWCFARRMSKERL